MRKCTRALDEIAETEMELSNNQIAGVIGISDKLVAKILRRIKDFERDTGKKFLEYSTELSTAFFTV